MNRGLKTVLALLSTFPGAALAAEIEIVSLDDPNEGLNDASPRSPEGGNFGSTLGAQRRNALEFVAGILGDRLQSQVPIRVSVRFDDLACESDRANLGQAGPAILVSDFPNAPEPGVVYPIALARALAGERLLEGDDLAAVFNDRLDAGTGCVGGNRWYYGLDGNAPEGAIDFAPVAAHELVHGLGFVSFVDPESGKLLQDENGIEFPDIFSSQILDRSLGALWPDLTDAQRRDSVTNGESVVWAGATTTSQGGPALTGGTNSASQVQLYAPGTLDPGSSISHWDPAAAPDLLMEPFATPDLGIREGIGLATCALEDIGWSLAAGVRCPDGALESASDDGGDHSSGSGCSGGGGESDDEATIVKVDPVLPLALAVALSGVVRTRPKAQRRLERKGSRS